MMTRLALFSTLVVFISCTVSVIAEEEAQYGVDVSFPIHHETISNNYAWLPHNVDPDNNPTPAEYKDMPVQPLGDRRQFYEDFMEGCRKKYQKGKKNGACDFTERDRVEMSLRQPATMVNYTEMGFKKIRTPEAVWKVLSEFWDKNQNNRKPENWNKGNTYTNHWDSPTYMVSVEDTKLRGGGYQLKNKIWDAAKETLQEWTDQELTQCSLYGVRVYTEGSVLATHVDRLPLVSSAIVNVAQDVDEPWPIEVIAHDGTAHNVTMQPGDMVLYESHSVLHGRPFPLKGRYYANLFIHFEPVGHSLRHHGQDFKLNPKTGYREAVKDAKGGHEHHEDGLPDYIKAKSTEADKWRRRHPDNKKSARKQQFTTGSTAAHQYAQEGDLKKLTEVVDKLGHLVNAKDSNGWTPLMEGVRSGSEEVVKLLVDKGADINAVTPGSKGRTALFIAIEEHGDDNPIVEFLESLGALALGPEL